MNVSIIKKYQNKISYGVLVLALVSLAVFVIFPLLPQIETSSATQVTTLKAHFSAAFGGDGGGDGGGGDGGGGGGGDGGGCCGGTGGDDGGSTGGGGDSGGGGGDTTPIVTPIWVPYCTGAEGGANDWQWWEKTTNTDPIQYRFVRAGDGTCVPPPVDVCPNIDGVQATVPAGMTKDSAGNCITPPTTPSIVGSCVGTDVNISWSGGGPGVLYNYRVDAAASSWTGSCTSLNPGDYCVNNSSATSLSFTGTPGQTYNAWVHAVNTVGVTDAVSVRFSCPVIPPVDVCPNIVGDQATIPAGMIKDTAGNCVTPPVTVPLCDSFSLSPSTITSAQNVVLTWATTNADSVSISGGVGAVAVDGSVTRLVSEDTTFVLTATKGTQTATCQAAVDFNPVSNPVLSCDAFSISPSSVDRGSSATMSWNTTNADSVSIDNGIGSVSGDGTRDITVNEDRTYTLTATRGAQTVTCTAPVSVNSDGGGGGGGGSSSPRCIDFDASDTRIQAGESVELSWRTTRGDRLVIERDVFSTRDDDEVDRGSVIVKPTKDTKYTLTVYRGSRKDTCTTEIRVDDITTITTRDQEPLTSISFTNIPYTGFDAGPFLTSVFYTLLALWSLAVAYVLVIKRGSVLGFSLPFAQPVVGGHGTLMPHTEFMAHNEARAHAHVNPAVFAPAAHTPHAPVAPSHTVPENLPTVGYAQHVASKEVAHEVVVPAGERATIEYLEDAAHAHNVLLSSDALRAIIDQGETLHDNETLLTEVIARAKGAYPREDGWIILNRERVTALFADEESEEDTEVEEVSTPVHVEGFSTLAEAIVTGNTTLAYQKLGESPIFALADAAEALDAVVRARRGAGSASDMLMRAAAGVTDEKLKNAVVALTSAIDGTYDDEAAAIRLAIIKALKAVA